MRNNYKKSTRKFILLNNDIKNDKNTEAALTGDALVNRRVYKDFDGKFYFGKVDRVCKIYTTYLYHVIYEDGDDEDLNEAELLAVLI